MTDPALIPYPAHRPVSAPSPRPAQDSCQALVRLATIGAVVGASAAAARQIRRVQGLEATPVQALIDTGKAAVITGAAGAVANEGITRLAVLFATGTAVMYGVQRRLEPDSEGAEQ
jgi:hypothetical protein